MFISFAVLEILDQSLFFDVLMSSSASVEIHKRKRNNLTIIIHIMVDPHGHNDNIITLISEGNSQLT